MSRSTTPHPSQPTPTVHARRGGALRAPLTVLCLALATLLALPVAASAVDETPAGATGWVRVGHLSPDTPKAEIQLTSFAGGDTETLGEAEFGDLSGYERVPVGLYTLSLLAVDDAGAEPMLTRNVEVREDGATTIVATGEGDRVRASVLEDDLAPPADGQAKVRLISAANQPEALRASVVDGDVLARDLATGSATGYAQVPARTWEVELAAGDGPGEVSQVALEAGGVYTLVALDAPGDGLELRAVQDSGSSTSERGSMPVGGVDTGAGGMATGSGSDLPLLIGLGVLGSLAMLSRRAVV